MARKRKKKIKISIDQRLDSVDQQFKSIESEYADLQEFMQPYIDRGEVLLARLKSAANHRTALLEEKRIQTEGMVRITCGICKGFRVVCYDGSPMHSLMDVHLKPTIKCHCCGGRGYYLAHKYKGGASWR